MVKRMGGNGELGGLTIKLQRVKSKLARKVGVSQGQSAAPTNKGQKAGRKDKGISRRRRRRKLSTDSLREWQKICEELEVIAE